MNRNTVTTINQLQIGDRFYKAGDSKKTVIEKVEHKTVVTNYQTYKNHGKIDGDKNVQHFKADTKVVFLRHQ